MKVLGEFPSTSNLRPLVRADSAFYGCEVVNAARCGGADVSVSARLDKRVKATIATIAEDVWTTIEYTDAVYDEQTSRWVSRAEVARALPLKDDPASTSPNARQPYNKHYALVSCPPRALSRGTKRS